MANKIVTANIETDNFVDSTSRYTTSEVVLYGENSIVTFKTFKRNPLPPDADDKFTVVTKGTEFRPDLISQEAYGTPNFWWRILESNGMMDIWEFRAGVNIRVPSSLIIFSG